ncbi:hypothetical protein [Falsiroseomonas stagni]|uniref:Uncharacterized protein n=1 Tax=Falsiroseomonas stagni DSM 19981 TaxID=1123062 RepID=A0A1I4FCB4_9PROT|nr:hypothetical protein [Falsiroseomonas stagni]SFL14436.1 hypothetical protein SAMN02745775_1264 [Falsiroseomonas stagni DSM 19981]
MTQRRLLLASLTLVPFGVPFAARAHEPRRGPNGGQKVDIGTNHAELVAAGNTLRLFLFDGADRPIPAAGATAQAVILAGGRQATVALAPAGDNVLVGTGDFAAARGMRAVVTLTLPGQRPAQARFTPMDQN